MKNLRIQDITLQTESARHLGFREKLEIIHTLDAAGVAIIGLGAVTNEKADTLLVATARTEATHAVFSVPVTSPDEVDHAYPVISAAPGSLLSVALPVSTVQMEYLFHRKPKAMLEVIRQTVEHAKARGVTVEFCALDATRADCDFLTEALTVARQAGADILTLSDTAAEWLPSAATAAFSALPADTVYGVQTADTRYMATAVSVCAALGGASIIRTTMDGTDAAPLDGIVRALHGKEEETQIGTTVASTEIHRVCSTVRSLLHPTSESVLPTTKAAVTVSKLSPSSSESDVKQAAEAMGYALSASDSSVLYQSFCRITAKKAVITSKDLDALIASELHQVPATYRLCNYLITSGNVVTASAQLKIEKNGEPCEEIGMGDGPIDAAFHTLEKIIGRHFELDDFQIQSVTEGHEAVGSALVKLRDGGTVYSGMGSSTDIIGASIRAYLNAVNKIVYQGGVR